jgi:glycosyltransferase involved in cell wall biosynthesis
MNLGRRERSHFPESYKGFRLVRTHGRVFGIPPASDPDFVLAADLLFTHPAVLSAANFEEMCERIDAYDPAALRPEVLGQCDGHELVRHRGVLYAVPEAAAGVDLDVPDDRRRAGVIGGTTLAELEEKIRRAAAAEPVEFAGWLPVYERSGNCGKHPQFTHAGDPPPGYRFTFSGPRPAAGSSIWARCDRFLKKAGRALRGLGGMLRLPFAFVRPGRGVGVRTRLRVFGAMSRLAGSLLWRGCKLLPTLRFLQTRHLQSQLLLARRRGPVFLTSMPYTFGQDPWVIEIEDPTTLFYPLIQNGQTCDLDPRASPYFPVVKALLEAEPCKAIVTHMRSTAELVPALFDSEVIRKKVVYAPLGVKLPARCQRHEPRPDDAPIDLLFINSWCQVPSNFYLRGGLDVLEAFATLKVRYPQLRLTMRTALPPLADHYRRILESGWVRVIDRFMAAEEMAELHASSHVFLLPAARVHIVSLLQAMSYGLAVVGSDGWGMEEYLEDGRNGLVVRGRHGKVSWADCEAGLLREDYEPMYTADPRVVEGIVEAVSRLVEDRELRARLGRTARADVETRFNTEQWNRALQLAFDRAVGRDGTPRVVRFSVGMSAAQPEGQAAAR